MADPAPALAADDHGQLGAVQVAGAQAVERRDQGEAEVKTTRLPEAFTEALNRFGSEAWRAASEWAKDEIETARRTYAAYERADSSR